MSESASNSKNTLKTVCAVFLSFFNAAAFSVIYEFVTPTVFFGDNVYSFKPVSLMAFALCLIMLLRFLKPEVLKNRGRIVISMICGIALSVSALFATLLLYGDHTLYSGKVSVFMQILLVLGMAIFFIPMVSELVGVADRFALKESAALPPSKVFFYEKNNVVYSLIVWALTFLCFVPLFLYTWPCNFIADAGYQVYNYIDNNINTHHPILHTLLLGSLYKAGHARGDISGTLQFYSLIQMFVLSAAFAFFMLYAKEKQTSRGLRVILFALFALNPVISYYVVSTVKGVFCAAFLLFALTFLLRLLDGKAMVLNSVLLVLTTVMSCLFRNNMLYAIIIGGLIVVIFKRGLKPRVIALLLTVAIFITYKFSFRMILNVTDGYDKDSSIESMSVPLMCLARVAVNERDSLDPEIYKEICMYIDESSLSEYAFLIADPIKNSANEELLKTNKINFFKLFIKVGLKYPGAYIEAVAALTSGYYAPVTSPYYLTGSTKLYTVVVEGWYPQPEVINKLPFGSAFFNYMYGDREGRLRLPLEGWLWRSAVYFWGFVFAFLYLIYKKKHNNLFVLLFPFLYMLSCLLGPTSLFRYLFINIAALPIALYLVIRPDATSSKEARD